MSELNIELFKRLRMRFKRMRHPRHFNMSDYAMTNKCGTAFCVAGHALDLQGYKIKGKGAYLEGGVEFISPQGESVGAYKAARDELQLSYEEADSLFTDYGLKTPQQAAERMERIIKTGKVLE